MGRLLLLTGIGIAVIGLIVIVSERAGIRFGRLPGDIVYRGKNTTFYFPVVTCVLLSLALTLIAWLFRR